MKTKLLLFLIIICANVNAQTEWAPIGAKWYFSRTESLMPTNVGYVLYESVKDTIIQNKTTRVISKTYYHSNGKDISYLGNEYMFKENNKVFYWKNGLFYTLYDFNAQTGEKWTIYGKDNVGDFCNYDSLGVVTVDSISYMTINGKELKVLYTSPFDSSDWGFGGLIIENIGCINHILPQAVDCALDIPHEFGPLRCYNDNNLGNYKTNYWEDSNYDCDALWYYTSVKDIKNNQIQYFPNPAEDYLNIKLTKAYNKKPIQIQIFDIDGVLIYAIQNTDKISVKNLPPGLYYSKVTNSEQTFYFKFIKK